MKNTGRKIFILGVVVAIAIAGILAFYPTIVTPPTGVPVSNLHKSSLRANINDFSDSENTVFNDSIYDVVIDKLSLYKAEAFLTEVEIDSMTMALVREYLPVFTKQSYAKFNASEWREADHDAMLERIAQLRTLTVDYGEVKAVTGLYDNELSKIEQVIRDYGNAKRIAMYSTFHSVNDANTKIQKAEAYRVMKPLSNCMDLVEKLATVKVKIGNSHYRYVESKVAEMAHYYRMSEGDFSSLVSMVNDDIHEYENNRSKYGDRAKTADELKRKANEYYRSAREYYYVGVTNISTNNQWVSIISPHEGYRAYQSYSNVNIPNSDAMMSFTFKGYESFTFYIRSNGESGCDYVMVGVNKQPTIVSNYSNTKDFASSGTSFLSYKTVHLRNLYKSSTYTIYVVYHKDMSNNRGTDRGYVLIPYTND